MSDYPTEKYFDLEGFPWPELFDGLDAVWDVLPRIKEFLERWTDWSVSGEVDERAVLRGDRIHVAAGAKIDPDVYIVGPCVIGPGCEVRQGAFIRGNVIMGPKSVLGHTSEAKNAIFLNGAKAAHFAYVGDSVLGRDVNLGAGTKLANFKMRSATREVRVTGPDGPMPTGLRKFGAILGDEVDIGCNAVTMPGAMVGPRSVVFPTVVVHGVIPPDSVVRPASGVKVEPRNAG